MNNGSFFPFLLFMLAIFLILTDPDTPQEVANRDKKVQQTNSGTDVHVANSWIACPIPDKRNLVCEMTPVDPTRIVSVDLDTCDVFFITRHGNDVTIFTNAMRKDQNCINGIDIVPPSKTQ